MNKIEKNRRTQTAAAVGTDSVYVYVYVCACMSVCVRACMRSHVCVCISGSKLFLCRCMLKGTTHINPPVFVAFHCLAA